MTATDIAVQCSDRTVRAALEAWLAGLRLAAPLGVILNVRITDEDLDAVPEIVFEFDKNVDHSSHIASVLAQLKRLEGDGEDGAA